MKGNNDSVIEARKCEAKPLASPMRRDIIMASVDNEWASNLRNPSVFNSSKSVNNAIEKFNYQSQ